MTSKIIKLEKERQERFLDPEQGLSVIYKNCHKQSLINLKEYMEGTLARFTDVYEWDGQLVHIFLEDTEEDIKELNKMIEKYG